MTRIGPNGLGPCVKCAVEDRDGECYGFDTLDPWTIFTCNNCGWQTKVHESEVDD